MIRIADPRIARNRGSERPIGDRPLSNPGPGGSSGGRPGRTGGLHVAGAPTLIGAKLAWSPADRAPTRHSVQYRRHDSVEAWTAVLQPPTQPEYTVDGLTSGVAYDSESPQ